MIDTTLSIDLRTLGAWGNGYDDDTEIVKKALNDGYTYFDGGIYKITDQSILNKLKNTRGTSKVIYKDCMFPFGDIWGFGISMQIPRVFNSIYDALDWLSYKRISGPGGEAFIKVEDGIYYENRENVIDHIDGKNIKIIGNEQDPTKCSFEFDNSNNRSFFLSESSRIGYINGFSIKGISNDGWKEKGKWGSNCYGAGGRAINGGILKFGPNMLIDKMYYGLRAMYSSKIEANYNSCNKYGGGLKVTNAGDVGIHAYGGSSIEANGCEVYNTGDSELGFGFCSENGSFISCEYAISSNNLKAGFYSLSNGSMWAHSTTGNENKYGVLAWNGTVECNSLDLTSTYKCNEIGIYSTYSGFIGATKSVCSGNGIGYEADRGGLIDISFTTAHNNNTLGYSANLLGNIVGDLSYSVQNGEAGYKSNQNSAMHIRNSKSEGNIRGYISINNSSIIAEAMTGLNKTQFCYPVQYEFTNTQSDSNSVILSKIY